MQILHRVVREIHSLWDPIATMFSVVVFATVERWVRWHLPREGFVALNTDGNSLRNPGPSGFGGVLLTVDEVGCLVMQAILRPLIAFMRSYLGSFMAWRFVGSVVYGVWPLCGFNSSFGASQS